MPTESGSSSTGFLKTYRELKKMWNGANSITAATESSDKEINTKSRKEIRENLEPQLQRMIGRSEGSVGKSLVQNHEAPISDQIIEPEVKLDLIDRTRLVMLVEIAQKIKDHPQVTPEEKAQLEAQALKLTQDMKIVGEEVTTFQTLIQEIQTRLIVPASPEEVAQVESELPVPDASASGSFPSVEPLPTKTSLIKELKPENVSVVDTDLAQFIAGLGIEANKQYDLKVIIQKCHSRLEHLAQEPAMIAELVLTSDIVAEGLWKSLVQPENKLKLAQVLFNELLIQKLNLKPFENDELRRSIFEKYVAPSGKLRKIEIPGATLEVSNVLLGQAHRGLLVIENLSKGAEAVVFKALVRGTELIATFSHESSNLPLELTPVGHINGEQVYSMVLKFPKDGQERNFTAESALTPSAPLIPFGFQYLAAGKDGRVVMVPTIVEPEAGLIIQEMSSEQQQQLKKIYLDFTEAKLFYSSITKGPDIVDDLRSDHANLMCLGEKLVLNDNIFNRVELSKNNYSDLCAALCLNGFINSLNLIGIPLIKEQGSGQFSSIDLNPITRPSPQNEVARTVGRTKSMLGAYSGLDSVDPNAFFADGSNSFGLWRKSAEQTLNISSYMQAHNERVSHQSELLLQQLITQGLVSTETPESLRIISEESKVNNLKMKLITARGEADAPHHIPDHFVQNQNDIRGLRTTLEVSLTILNNLTGAQELRTFEITTLTQYHQYKPRELVLESINEKVAGDEVMKVGNGKLENIQTSPPEVVKISEVTELPQAIKQTYDTLLKTATELPQLIAEVNSLALQKSAGFSIDVAEVPSSTQLTELYSKLAETLRNNPGHLNEVNVQKITEKLGTFSLTDLEMLNGWQKYSMLPSVLVGIDHKTVQELSTETQISTQLKELLQVLFKIYLQHQLILACRNYLKKGEDQVEISDSIPRIATYLNQQVTQAFSA